MSITENNEIHQFLQYLQFEKRYSQHTITAYQTDLTQFSDYLVHQYDGVPMNRVTPAFIRSWLASLRNDKVSVKSINRKISSLKSYYRSQMKSGQLVQSPMATIVSPKIQKRLPSFVSEKEMDRLTENVQFDNTWNGVLARLIISILYGTGIRLSELIQLKQNNVDLYNHQLKVLGKGNKERIIPIAADIVQQVKDFIKLKQETGIEDNSLLLVSEKGKPLYPKYVYNLVKKNLQLVTTLNKKSPHVLRHTFATHLANNGADLNAIKELLGHASLAATQVYTHNTIDKLKNVHKQAHPKG